MSWQRLVLNRWLRLVERRALARAREPARLRASFERKAKLLFHPPRGTDMRDIRMNNVAALRLRPPGPIHRTLLYFHGGAYIFGSPNTHSAMLAHIARAAQAEAILPHYPLAPEAPFPAAPQTARRAYDALNLGNPVILGGDSAGGGLALSLLAQLIQDGAALPSAAFALSPLTDLTFSGVSFAANADQEVVLEPAQAARATGMYLPPGQAPDDPRASPLFADFTGAPPIWLCAGDTEVLLDDTRRMAARLSAQDVPVTQIIARDLPHVWPIFHNVLPEARATIADLGAWIKDQTPVSES